MRTYDPTDRIRYVHLGRRPAGPPHLPDECNRLPAGYPNVSIRSRLGEGRATGARPTLVLLRGGSSAADGTATATSALRPAVVPPQVDDGVAG